MIGAAPSPRVTPPPLPPQPPRIRLPPRARQTDSNQCIAFIYSPLGGCIIPSAFLQRRIDSPRVVCVLLRFRGLRCFFRAYIDLDHQTLGAVCQRSWVCLFRYASAGMRKNRGLMRSALSAPSRVFDGFIPASLPSTHLHASFSIYV